MDYYKDLYLHLFAKKQIQIIFLDKNKTNVKVK